MNHSTQSAESLLERIGGTRTIETLVGALYFNILQDHRLAHFFERIPLERVLTHQRHFLTIALGGVDRYTGRSLRDAHRHLIDAKGLRSEHFDAVIENLETTMTDLAIDPTVTQEVVAIVEATRAEVLGS